MAKPKRKVSAAQRAILLKRLAKARAVKAAKATVKEAGKRPAALRKRKSRASIRARSNASLKQQRFSKFSFTF